jgi:hypothetical protein
MFLNRVFHTVTVLGLVLSAKRFTIALEVFHGVEKTLLTTMTGIQSPCLVTNTFEKSYSRRNMYPVDLFGDSLSDDTHPCFFQPSKLHQEAHSCSKSRFICPIKEEYIPITMTGFENASSQICQSLRSLEAHKSEQNVNLIIFGGSVTNGGIAGGCVEDSCTEINSDGNCLLGSGSDCAWHRGLFKYLQQRYENPHLNVIELAVGATTSCTLPHLLAKKLEAGGFNLTSRDLVLYDYSVNDGAAFTSPAQLQRLQHCMETNLEKLAQYSQDGHPPAVILLEYYPYKSLNVREENPDPTDSYTKIYREVARQFHLPIISYRDLFWHPLFREHLKQFPKFADIVQNKWAEATNLDLHPPWIVQDLLADVVAGALDLTHHLCKNRMGDSLIEIATEQRQSSPIHEQIVILDEVATIANAPFLTPEEVHRLPHGWNLYQDRLGKPGWIAEEQVGGKNVFDAILTFTVPDSTSSVPANSPATLEVSYMQTYKNAGAFIVVVCDSIILTPWPEHQIIVDTLIEDHYTSLDVAVFEVGELETVCKHESVVVKIFHKHLDDRLESRGTQKVKIASVRLTVSKPSPPITQVTIEPELCGPETVPRPSLRQRH